MNPTIQFDTVAHLYDYYVNVDFDIDFFLQEAKKARGKVLELTCGTGRVSIPLLQAGVDLTCVDYSERMLTLFRKKLAQRHLSCNTILMDITRLSLREQYDLIFIPFHSFSEIADRSKHVPTLERIRSHLTDDGYFICTLQNPKVRITSLNGTLTTLGTFPMDKGRTLVVKSLLWYDAATHVVSGNQFYEIYSSDKTVIGKKQLDIRFYLFTKNEFARLIQKAGFETAALYGDYAYAPFSEETSPYMIWLLKNTVRS
jgi:SAM-dependent methyltransferase